MEATPSGLGKIIGPLPQVYQEPILVNVATVVPIANLIDLPMTKFAERPAAGAIGEIPDRAGCRCAICI